MKRIKIMLAAVAIFSVVGGTVAFKAQKGGAFCIVGTTCPFASNITIVPNGAVVNPSCTDQAPASTADCSTSGYLE
jgi:hypothetical protein